MLPCQWMMVANECFQGQDVMIYGMRLDSNIGDGTTAGISLTEPSLLGQT